MKHQTILRIVYNVIVLLIVAAGAYLVVDHFVHFGKGEYTDNATVQQHITPVNTRVSGFIKEIRFAEYQQVHKGDTLVIIEDSEFRLRLAQAEAEARYAQAQRSLGTLRSTEKEQGHRLSQNAAAIDVARSAVELARLNLSYTVIVATADGVVGKKNIHEGQLVQPGQTMVDIVDNSDLWVVANYRETQLPNIQTGAVVKIEADAVPDVEFEGTVERISDATGSAFSLIPLDNATGNFVKVEQRIPVRIRLKNNAAIQRLRAGMNVECTVMP